MRTKRIEAGRVVGIGVAFLLTACFMLVATPKRAFADVVATAQKTDDLNCNGNGIREYVFRVAGRCVDPIPIILPEDGYLRLSCDRDSSMRLTYDSAGYNSVYAKDILAKGTYYYQARAGYSTTTFKIKAWYYSAADQTLSPNGVATGVAFEHSDGFVQSQLFKVDFPSRGWAKVWVDLPNGVRAAPMIGISDASKRLYGNAGTLYQQDGNYPAYFAIEPGTKYLFVANFRTPFKIHCDFHPYGDSNFSYKKAKSLKAGRKQTCVVFSKDKRKKLTRVYKIKLKKKQKVRITYETPYATAGITNKNGKKVYKMTTRGNVSTTNKKLKKGTYYIVFKYNFGNQASTTMGETAIFSWK